MSFTLIWLAISIIWALIVELSKRYEQQQKQEQQQPRYSVPPPTPRYLQDISIPAYITPWDSKWSEPTWALYRRLIHHVGGVEQVRKLVGEAKLRAPGRSAHYYLLQLCDRLEPPQPQEQRQAPASRPFEFTATTGPVPYLDRELLDLVRGDKQAAYRLLRGVQERNPGRSPQWCYEKVIRDLTRDRH